MNTREFAIIGVRLVGLASTLIGIGLWVSAVLIQGMPTAQVDSSITTTNFVTIVFLMRKDLILPGAVALIMGSLLSLVSPWVASRLTKRLRDE